MSTNDRNAPDAQAPAAAAPLAFDARRFKAMERAGFNRIAARYAEGAHLRADLAAALLDAAALAPGQRVLDLASGPGLLARDAALRVAPGGTVLATDIAEGEGGGIEQGGGELGAQVRTFGVACRDAVEAGAFHRLEAARVEGGG